jgi:hypothetical protein
VRSVLFVSALAIFALCHVNDVHAQYARQQEPVKPPVRPKVQPGWMPTMLVDCPTAGTRQRGSFDITMRVEPNGGILAATNIGLSNRFMVGISYGAKGIIAEERPTWNPRIEFNVKLNLVDEGFVFPAVTLGFSSQGYGPYNDSTERYDFKSKGFYAVGSKNYPFYEWQLGLHGGVNYSTEQEDKDENLDFFIGLDTRLNKDVGLVVEYDFATNDNRRFTSQGRGRGYLNVAIQWLYTDNLVMEVLLKNLNNNRKSAADIWRGLRVVYVEHF